MRPLRRPWRSCSNAAPQDRAHEARAGLTFPSESGLIPDTFLQVQTTPGSVGRGWFFFVFDLPPLPSRERARVRGSERVSPRASAKRRAFAPLASFRHPRARGLAHFPASCTESTFSVGFDWLRFACRELVERSPDRFCGLPPRGCKLRPRSRPVPGPTGPGRGRKSAVLPDKTTRFSAKSEVFGNFRKRATMRNRRSGKFREVLGSGPGGITARDFARRPSHISTCQRTAQAVAWRDALARGPRRTSARASNPSAL